MAYEAVKLTINDQVGWRVYMGRVNWVRVFNVGRCVLREWVVGGGVLDGYFGEQWASRIVLKVSPRMR